MGHAYKGLQLATATMATAVRMPQNNRFQLAKQ